MKTGQLISAADATVNPTVSVELEIGDLTTYSIQVTFSGATLGGALTLESSDDNVTYITVLNSSVTVVAAAPNMYNVSGAGYRFVRVRWVPTGGTGTITALGIIKEPANRF